jgi:hypothetical protein
MDAVLSKRARDVCDERELRDEQRSSELEADREGRDG